MEGEDAAKGGGYANKRRSCARYHYYNHLLPKTHKVAESDKVGGERLRGPPDLGLSLSWPGADCGRSMISNHQWNSCLGLRSTVSVLFPA
jgi:hypothetical protein